MTNAKKKLGLVIALVVIVGGIFYAVHEYRAEKKADKAGMKNPLVCKDEDGAWVPVPNGFRKNKKTGACVEKRGELQQHYIAPTPEPSTRLLTFEKEGPIISFKYKGGPLVCVPQDGEVEIVDPSGNKWKDKPGMLVNRVEKLHRGWHFISRTPGSKATGVKITQLW